jgi:putative DNA primase/helicase
LQPQGVHSATTDPKNIRRLWKRWPNANVAVATGAKTFDVLDVDTKEDVSGIKALKELAAEHGELPHTVTHKSGGGGIHYLFKPNGGKLKNAVAFAPGLDVKTDGGYLIMPPSVHVSGNRYEHTGGGTDFAEWPAWLLNKIRERREESESGGRGKLDPLQVLSGVPKGERDDKLLRYACQLRAKGVTREEAQVLVCKAAAHCHPPFPEWEAFAKVESAWKYEGGADDTGKAQTFNLTEMGNAKRLAALHGKDIRYCREWRRWLAWDGTRWEVDTTGDMERRAKDTVMGLYGEAAQTADDNRRQALAKWAGRSESDRMVKAMLSLAESEPGIPVKAEELDRDPWLLNCLNGTVDLKTGELRPHRREDLITKRVPVEYRPEADYPHWKAHLNRIMGGDEEMVSFLQRVLGYSITGLTDERKLFIAYGSGANGKTTTIEVVAEILNDYAMRTTIETFLTKPRGALTNDVARLRSARFAHSSEAEEGQKLAEARVKELTGGDTVCARALYQDFSEFRPQFKPWMCTNHLPEIKGNDDAIWSRICQIPFTVSIPEAERMPQHKLMERFRPEFPGILIWLMQGCLEWQADGLREPAKVKVATAKYRTDMDGVGRFVRECCAMAPGEKVPTRAVYAAYEAWCRSNGEMPVEPRAFGTRLGEVNIKGKQSHGVRYYLGIRILPPKERGEGTEGTEGTSVLLNPSIYLSRVGVYENDGPDGTDGTPTEKAESPRPDSARCEGCPYLNLQPTWPPEDAMCQWATKFLRDMDCCPLPEGGDGARRKGRGERHATSL